MKISLFLAALLIATLLTGSQSIRYHNLKSAKNLSHKLFSFVNQIYGHQGSVHIAQDGSTKAFFDWLASEDSIMNSLNSNTPFSANDAQKVKNYLHDHPELFSTILQSSPGAQGCFGGMNASQKRNFVLIVIDQTDFSPLATGAPLAFTSSQVNTIKNNVSKSNELSSFADICTGSLNK